MNLAEFLDRYREAITTAVVRAYPPVFDAAALGDCGFDLGVLRRRPLGGQADAIRATALSLQRQAGTNVVGEMGCGKSLVAAAAAHLAGCRRVLVICPPHLVRKWRREILDTVPDASVAIVRTTANLERARTLAGPRVFVVCSRERAKLGYRWRPAVVSRPARLVGGGPTRDAAGAVLRLLCCPGCHTPATDAEDVPLTADELGTKKHRCRACGRPLWGADRTGPRRTPLADYVRRRLPGFFELLIADEVQELKGKGTAQGLAVGALAQACGRSLTLTGTLSGGYSSTLFYLLWRFSPAVRREFGYHDESRWVARYGVVERITKHDPEARAGDGRQSRRRTYQTRVVEKPGVSPAVLLHLIGNTVFLRLADVARDLPPYTERVTLLPLDPRPVSEEQSQAAAYRRLAGDLRQAVGAALGAGSKRLLGAYLQALLACPDACTRGETVSDPVNGEVIAQAPALPAATRYPKEQALLDLVRRERARGRRVLVYLTHTERRDLSPRLRAVLEPHGLRVAVLKADTVPADRREAWVADRVREGADVLLCHPRLVQTGLDLVDWPSICWYQTDYSVYVLRQASRRSWRIGQRQPVEVTYLVYEGTLQAEALALVAAKMRSALMVEGELPEDGLAALEGDGQDVVLTLARRLLEQEVGEARSLEALFANTKTLEAEAEDLLDDDAADALGSATSGAGAPSSHRSSGETDHLQPRADAPAQPVAARMATGPAPPPVARVVTVEELARSIRRPRARRRPVPKGQLTLFDA